MVNKKNTINNSRKRKPRTTKVANNGGDYNDQFGLNPFKYEVGFTQSVSSGIVAIHGSFKFNNMAEGVENLDSLCKVVGVFEDMLEHKGYTVARKIEPKTKGSKSIGKGNHDSAVSECNL